MIVSRSFLETKSIHLRSCILLFGLIGFESVVFVFRPLFLWGIVLVDLIESTGTMDCTDFLFLADFAPLVSDALAILSMKSIISRNVISFSSSVTGVCGGYL